MKIPRIKNILQMEGQGQELIVEGWIRTKRESKGLSFLELNDGSSIKNLQIIVEESLPGYESIMRDIATGCSVSVKGNLVASPAEGQNVELKASSITIVGACPA